MNWAQTRKNLNLDPSTPLGAATYQALFDYIAGHATPKALGQSAFLHFPMFGMTTPQRIAEFIAQTCNETGGYTVWEENLNYSPNAMLKTWPTHFNPTLAAWAYKHPDRVAELAYGGRMGNTTKGDGYKYRGRGMLQLTGKANYSRFGELLGLDLVNHPELASDPSTSLLIALEFFKLGNVNAAVDAQNYKKARQITNGGSIGLEHVAMLRNKLLKVLV